MSYLHVFLIRYVLIGSDIEDGDELVRSYTSQIAFFCGMKRECRIFGSTDALQLAKKNVEKYYAVVGVLEEMEKSLVVFEKFIPKYLDKSSTVYKAMMDGDLEKVNVNIFKPSHLPEFLSNNLMRNFTLEMDFYRFCKARLHKQYISF